MATKDYKELSLDSDVFSSARANFDLLMQELIEKMKTAESEEGSIFDPDFEDTLKSDSDEEQRGNALPGPESKDEPIDTDFIDVPDEEPDMGVDEAENGDYDYDEPTEEGEEDEE